MKTLVFGASLKPERYANIATKRLLKYNHEVVAFGIREGSIETVTIDTELKQYDDIDTVTMYINPKRQEAYYDYIISLKPRRVIFNPGTENPAFMELLTKNNIEHEMACTLVLLSTNNY